MQAAPFDASECERFLVHEARLLDEGRFDRWLSLFTSDAWYWVPCEPDQASPRDTISLIYDDRRLLETRVRRLASPRIYSQEPRSRTSRIIANVTIEEAGDAACTVRSKFQLLEYRRETQRVFGGTCFHRLVRCDDGIQIAWKRVDLVNCDAPHEGLVVPF
jgi:benzoate/toluate 1,2-dioxygenase beta subunit